VNDLPLFPTNIDALLVSAVKPSMDGMEMLRLIDSDPNVRREMLTLAQSYFGSTKDLKTVEDAVSHLGLQPLVQLIGISYAKDAINKEFAALKYLQDYVKHAEDIFVTCNILGEICKMPQAECRIYALAGMVHDVGRLAIISATGNTGSRVLGTMWDRMSSVVNEEAAELGTNHCDVGARICSRWNLSPVVQEAVKRHHTPFGDGDFSFGGALIFISHFIADSDPSGEILATLLSTQVLGKLNLSTADFEKARSLYQSRIGLTNQ
jgi:HD-like signal output (HDOD) protein